jgi:hydrogenase maturation protease
MKKGVLIAGIGNIFHGDDAFGVEVAQRLLGKQLPAGVTVIDFGIRGFDLAFALLDGYETYILVDVVQRGQPPGTLYLIEPEIENATADRNGHGMDPVRVLRLAQEMGGPSGRVLLVGCEPETFGPEEEGRMGLSAVVMEAVNAAVLKIETLVTECLSSAKREADVLVEAVIKGE